MDVHLNSPVASATSKFHTLSVQMKATLDFATGDRKRWAYDYECVVESFVASVFGWDGKIDRSQTANGWKRKETVFRHKSRQRLHEADTVVDKSMGREVFEQQEKRGISIQAGIRRAGERKSGNARRAEILQLERSGIGSGSGRKRSDVGNGRGGEIGSTGKDGGRKRSWRGERYLI